jgi:hypothetical protein
MKTSPVVRDTGASLSRQRHLQLYLKGLAVEPGRTPVVNVRDTDGADRRVFP